MRQQPNPAILCANGLTTPGPFLPVPIVAHRLHVVSCNPVAREGRAVIEIPESTFWTAVLGIGGGAFAWLMRLERKFARYITKKEFAEAQTRSDSTIEKKIDGLQRIIEISTQDAAKTRESIRSSIVRIDKHLARYDKHIAVIRTRMGDNVLGSGETGSFQRPDHDEDVG